MAFFGKWWCSRGIYDMHYANCRAITLWLRNIPSVEPWLKPQSCQSRQVAWIWNPYRTCSSSAYYTHHRHCHYRHGNNVLCVTHIWTIITHVNLPDTGRPSCQIDLAAPWRAVDLQLALALVVPWNTKHTVRRCIQLPLFHLQLPLALITSTFNYNVDHHLQFWPWAHLN